MSGDDEATLGRGGSKAVEAVAALADSLRRRLYDYVRERAEPVSRDDVAGATGISPRLAAFHLDKLVGKGLLRAHYARKRGRAGPGAGRSSKFYQPTETELVVSIPQRRYDVLGRILVEAAGSCDAAAAATLQRAAERVARAHGQEAGRREHPVSPTGDALAAVARTLARYGFEPAPVGGDVLTLRNCPFHALADQEPELVCAVNLALVEGVVDGLAAGDASARAVLRPAAGRCCVQVHRAAADPEPERSPGDAAPPERG